MSSRNYHGGVSPVKVSPKKSKKLTVGISMSAKEFMEQFFPHVQDLYGQCKYGKLKITEIAITGYRNKTPRLTLTSV